jgi:hypothetical protein
MISQNPWPRPPLAADGELPDADRVRWYLRLAITCSPEANAVSLAAMLGVSPNTIYLSVSRGTCTHDLAARIETLYGKDYFPRELLAPQPVLPDRGA